MKNKKGFTLIELMIVVAIIAIISAIAIPSLMKARMHANQAGAIGSLKTLSTAQYTYYEDENEFASDFGYMATIVPPDLDDQTLATANFTTTSYVNVTAKAGYYFASNTNYSSQSYVMYAAPASYASSGTYTYIINSSGTCYQIDESVPATPDAIKVIYGASGVWDPTNPNWSTAR